MKILFRDVISDLNGEKIVETFHKKKTKKTVKKKKDQKEHKMEKIIKRKDDKLYVTWKDYNNWLLVGLIKKTVLYKNELFSTL